MPPDQPKRTLQKYIKAWELEDAFKGYFFIIFNVLLA